MSCPTLHYLRYYFNISEHPRLPFSTYGRGGLPQRIKEVYLKLYLELSTYLTIISPFLDEVEE